MSNPSDPNAQQPVAPAAPAAPATPAAPAAPAATAYAAPAAPVVYTAPRTNTLAIVALIVSFFPSFQIVAVILGHIALSQIKKTHEGGRGLAIAALIIGYVITFIAIITLVVVITAATSAGVLS